MLDRIEELRATAADLEERLADPDVIAQPDKLAEYGRRHAEIAPILRAYEDLEVAQQAAAEAEELVAEAEDAEELGFYADELAVARGTVAERASEVRELLIPKDPNDVRNVILEVRAAAGGDEAGLFAADLYRMYTRYAERRGLKPEILSSSPTGVGGFKEVVFEVRGKRAFADFKFEGSTHRVQRVPETEASGRIHTSTATVAVLPEAEEVDVAIDPNDLQIDVYRSSGPGGQSVNTTDSAVRITHEPTGLVVSCQDEKSQLQNKEKAMRILRSRLLSQEQERQAAEISADRRAQVGSGERSEKIRTYNFPQNRVTDHRITFTTHDLTGVLDGDIGPVVEALRDEERAALVESHA